MADKYFLSIIEEMDQLWYHQIILFSKPTTQLVAKLIEEKHVSISESSSSSSSSSSILSLPPLLDEETSTDESLSPQKQVSSESVTLHHQDDSIDKKEEIKEILEKMSLFGNRIGSHSSCSSSPTTRNRRRKWRKHAKLEKSMSCRTLGELELDEVKGFMDLGFRFNKECIDQKMISVVPGLQRFCLLQNKQHYSQSQIMASTKENDEIIEVCEEKRDIMRPYLSEAWLIKRPDSPLLNMKIPKSCSASNMKKHIRFWAKIVASEIQQE